MHILKILSVAFLLLETAGCSGLGFACTDVGCFDGLDITLDKKIVPWETGKYTFTVDADGSVGTCTVNLPLVDDKDIVCSNSSVLLVDTNATATTASNQGVSTLHVFVAAKKISVTISHEGAELVTQVYEPMYNEVQPNGPSCDPTCHQAKATLAVP